MFYLSVISSVHRHTLIPEVSEERRKDFVLDVLRFHTIRCTTLFHNLKHDKLYITQGKIHPWTHKNKFTISNIQNANHANGFNFLQSYVCSTILHNLSHIYSFPDKPLLLLVYFFQTETTVSLLPQSIFH